MRLMPLRLMAVLALAHLAWTADLAREFLDPPADSRPWALYWWQNGNTSKAGVTRDFEEMRRQGIGGAALIDAGMGDMGIPRGPAFMGEAWRELFRHAVREAERCGLVLSVNMCSGWNAGGPWIGDAHAAKKLVSAQVIVKGPGRQQFVLPRPPTVKKYYRDIAVLAAPVTSSENGLGRLSASSAGADTSLALAEDGDDETCWVSPGDKPGMGPTPERPVHLQFDLAEQQAAAALWLVGGARSGPKDIAVQCSDDGGTFRTLQTALMNKGEARRIEFPETTAKHFRVLIRSAHPEWDGSRNVQVAEIALLPKGLPDGRKLGRYRWNGAAALDLSSRVDAAGRLEWEVPAGEWRILRLGYTLYGRNIYNCGSGTPGPEIDPMMAEAMDHHFAETGAKLIADAGPLAGKTLLYLHLDSWEMGQPTWSPKLGEEFARRRGYDPLPYLPVLVGRTMEDAARAERFAKDVRRTMADLVADNYYGRLADLARRGGLLGSDSESGGPYFSHSIDALQCLGREAAPMGEFWARNSERGGDIQYGNHNISVKQAAAAAHIYGRRDCHAEAFTSLAHDFNAAPWDLKDIGDGAFCDGVTRMVIHEWQSHARPEEKPGYNLNHIGTHLDYNLTWWPMADGWLRYLGRCQHLLRQGLFVADFAYLQPETVPGFIQNRFTQQPLRPAGFDYDPLNAEVLLTRASAKDGRLILPDGMSYRYLVLPEEPDAIRSPATLKKIDALAAAGVNVLGPGRRAGLLEQIVRTDGLAPDLEFRPASVTGSLDWIHRRSADTDIYFVCNQTTDAVTTEILFRVDGRQPELWDAVTGSIRDLPEWRREDGRILVPLRFAPRQSWFVVFRRPLPDRKEGGGANIPVAGRTIELSGPWEIAFDPQWGGPERIAFPKLEDWTARPEEGIRYYSGIAVYRKTFMQEAAPAAGERVLLRLGLVKNVARVRLNGQDLGPVWTAPWEVDLGPALKTGANALEIEVANLWPNRLIGDAQLPPEKRLAISNCPLYDPVLSPQDKRWGEVTWAMKYCNVCKDRLATGRPPELLSSGLLGPVTISVERDGASSAPARP